MPAFIKSFLIRLLFFSLIAFGLIFIFQQYGPLRFKTSLYWVILLFFIISKAIIHIVLVNTSNKDSKNFVSLFLGITGIKLFSYLIIIITYGLINREGAAGFILCFLFSYFLFSVFEVASLLKHFKKWFFLPCLVLFYYALAFRRNWRIPKKIWNTS